MSPLVPPDADQSANSSVVTSSQPRCRPTISRSVASHSLATWDGMTVYIGADDALVEAVQRDVADER